MGEAQMIVDDVADDVASAIASVNERASPEPVAEKVVEAKPEPVEAKTEVESVKTDAEKDRDALGRFTKKQAGDERTEVKPVEVKAEKPIESKTAEAKTAEKLQPVETKPAAAAPPPGWSIKSKSEWDKLPQHVRDDIAKRETEVSSGFEQYQGLRPYAERAKNSGQTLTQALQAYTGIEDMIRRDFGGGVLHIAANAGLTQNEAAQIFAGLAQRLGHQFAPGNQNAPGGSVPEQNGAADPQALRQVLDPFVSPLSQRLQQLENLITQQTEGQQRQRLNTVTQVIENFRQAPEHKYYDNLEETIGDLLEGGVVKRTGDFAADLSKAYEMACRLNPEISEALISERVAKTAEEKAKQAREAAEKARNASRSVTGSPSPGADAPKKVNGSRPGTQSYDDDLNSDVAAAVRAVAARA